MASEAGIAQGKSWPYRPQFADAGTGDFKFVVITFVNPTVGSNYHGGLFTAVVADDD